MDAQQTAVTLVPETEEAQRYRAYKQEHEALAQRLAQIQGLTMDEVDEQVKLERLLANRQPMLERLAQEAQYAIAQVDAAQVKATHDALIPQKLGLYDRIAAAVAEVHAAFKALREGTCGQRQ